MEMIKDYKKCIYFDLETNGLPIQPKFDSWYPYFQTEKYDTSRIIQFGAVVTEGDFYLEADILLKPDFVIENSHIHNITQEYAEKNGVDFNILVTFLKTHIDPDNTLLLAHNSGFDINVLKSELYRRNEKELCNLLDKCNVLCTMKSTQNILKIPGRYKSYKYPKLIELYKYCYPDDNEVLNLHNALDDTRLMYKSIKKLMENEVI